MLRFSAYSKLGIQNLVIVAGDGQEFQILEDSATDLPELIHTASRRILLPIRLKVSPSSTRLLLQTINDFYLLVSICPVRILQQLATSGLLRKVIFPQSTLSSCRLSSYLRFITDKRPALGGAKFTPHSLRIGGHTFYCIKNMDADFVNFLGRRAISKACQLYYRAGAFDNITRLRRFFWSIRNQHILER